MSRCPFCDYVTPEPDDGDATARAWQEIAHMQIEHSDVIRARLEEFGPMEASVRFERPSPTAVDHMRESRIARARGLALAISECRDDARLDGIREGAAEIAELLGD
jgi:hypothetical protein